MRIERISDNQIKCTLNRSDLAMHHVKVSELAYGAEKAKELFQDMMEQAFVEFGFEGGDSLVVEAIPVSMDCIVLMITRVDEPEEIDTSFRGLSDLGDISLDDTDSDDADISDDDIDLDDLLGLEDIPSEHAHKDAASHLSLHGRQQRFTKSDASQEKIFSFGDLKDLLAFAHSANPYFKGKSSLYRSPSTGRYYTVLSSQPRSASSFGMVCSLALEYGSKEPSLFAGGAFVDEHFDVIISKKALQKLADV